MPAELNVFEAVNHARRATLVICSHLTLSEVLEHLASAPPAEAADWKPSEFAIDQIGAEIPPDDAETFLASLAQAPAAPGWKTAALRL